MTEYKKLAAETREDLNSVSPTFCLAKWLHSTIYLASGTTHSCHHTPVHKIPLNELKYNITALHNTMEKTEHRKMMLQSQRPEGCAYCWKIEDSGENQLSDRHYKSSESWAKPYMEEVLSNDFDHDINPRHLEVAFSQTCNFTCSYCSPRVSSSWEKEIREQGVYPTSGNTHALVRYSEENLMPLSVKQKENPYVNAFWEWWPDLYPDLIVFRITGGEPLMDNNTFKVLDYIAENPNHNLELSVTSNLCPPDQKLFKKFISKVSKILDNGSIQKFTLYVSLDSVGEQAEYIRYGANYQTIIENVETFLKVKGKINLVFINTFNILSAYNLTGFLKMIVDLRARYGEIEDSRVYFDIPILNHPYWQSVANLEPTGVERLKEALIYMKEHSNEVTSKNYLGFRDYEIAKLERNIMWIEHNRPNRHWKRLNMHDFYGFFNEYDRRRGLNILDVFPELADYWKLCKQVWTEAQENE